MIRRSRHLLVGAGLGLLVAAVTLALVSPVAAPGRVQTGPVLSDCHGAIEQLVIQYVGQAASLSAPVYAELLPQLPEDVTVQVLVPDAAAFADLRHRVGPVACRLRPIVTGHAMTTWSRDRWLAASDGQQRWLISPKREDGAEAWPARAGDARVGDDLAGAIPGLGHRRSDLLFDGGDVVVARGRALVAGRVAKRNIQHTVSDAAALLEALQHLLGREVILLGRSPDHHAGMYVMPAGQGRIFVADPAAGLALLGDPAHRPAELLGGPVDASARLQADLDAVAEQLTREGFEVHRMPVLAGADGRTWMTPLNGILDQRHGRRIVYMPVYRGAERLNEAAAALWRAAGFVVRPIDCTSSYRHFGSLRCLVNVLARR